MRSAGMMLFALFALAFASHAGAQRASSAELNEALEQLNGQDADQVRAAIESLGLLGDPRAVAPIGARVRRGLPPELLEVAIDTLMILGRTEAGPVLFELAAHRRAEVRARAVQAIAATRPRGADRVLGEALADSDGAVRAAAATGLGEIGATGALDTLFLALDRRVPEAATAIGRLARPAEVTRFLGYLGRMPFDLVIPALREMLLRAELAERARVDIVNRLLELATPEVRTFLEQMIGALPPSAARRAAEDGVGRMGR